MTREERIKNAIGRFMVEKQGAKERQSRKRRKEGQIINQPKGDNHHDTQKTKHEADSAKT